MSENGEKKRRSNWTRQEETILVEEVNKRESLLFGKLDGSSRTNKQKILAWEEVAATVNSNGNSEVRSVSEMKKKFQNIKQKAKSKRSCLLRPPTGGGPRPESPTTPEQLVLQNLEGRPSLCGISGGIDTDIPMTSEHAAEVGAEDTDIFSNLDSTFLDFSFVNNDQVKSVKKTQNIEELILQEELEKVKESRVLIQEQTKLARLQQQLTLLQIENAKKSCLSCCCNFTNLVLDENSTFQHIIKTS